MEIQYTKIGDIPAKLYRAEKADKAVLALHGFAGSKESFAIQALAERLCPQGFDVITIDWAAHGERERDFSQLTVPRCISDMIAAEEFIGQNLSDNISVFATSFGAYIVLRRMEFSSAPFLKAVLRVPAVNMADSLLNCARLSDPTETPEKARLRGAFRLCMGAEYSIPYSFYEEMRENGCVRASAVWQQARLSVVYAENDELVKRSDTEEFLRLNPSIVSKMITGCGHRMAESPQKLEQALDFAADFLR